MIQIFGLARIGRDVEVRRTTNDDAVASVSLAFTYGRKDNDGKKPTQWVDGALWGKRAEALAPYLVKGVLVTVAMEDAHTETYRKQDGTEATKLTGRIIAIDLAGGGEKKAAPTAAPAPRQQRTAPSRAPAAGAFDEMDDDVPF
jgi:single-strand DNA-binding protein